jgi:hypothetical protein
MEIRSKLNSKSGAIWKDLGSAETAAAFTGEEEQHSSVIQAESEPTDSAGGKNQVVVDSDL